MSLSIPLVILSIFFVRWIVGRVSYYDGSFPLTVVPLPYALPTTAKLRTLTRSHTSSPRQDTSRAVRTGTANGRRFLEPLQRTNSCDFLEVYIRYHQRDKKETMSRCSTHGSRLIIFDLRVNTLSRGCVPIEDMIFVNTLLSFAQHQDGMLLDGLPREREPIRNTALRSVSRDLGNQFGLLNIVNHLSKY